MPDIALGIPGEGDVGADQPALGIEAGSRIAGRLGAAEIVLDGEVDVIGDGVEAELAEAIDDPELAAGRGHAGLGPGPATQRALADPGAVEGVEPLLVAVAGRVGVLAAGNHRLALVGGDVEVLDHDLRSLAEVDRRLPVAALGLVHEGQTVAGARAVAEDDVDRATGHGDLG